MGRSAAPDDAQFDEVAGIWRIRMPVVCDHPSGDLVELVIDWEGDVAQLRADGVVIGDRFWDGREWRVDITALPPEVELTVHIAPLAAHSAVDLDEAARARVEAAGTLCGIRRIDRVVSSRWTETA